jgi:hypothetical protein
MYSGVKLLTYLVKFNVFSRQMNFFSNIDTETKYIKVRATYLNTEILRNR